MFNVYIIGAGGFGREVLNWIRGNPEQTSREDWHIAAFLDANPSALDGFDIDLGVIGDPAVFTPSENDRFVCAVGDPATKLRLCQQMRARGGKFVTIVASNVIVGSECKIGEGCILCPGVVVTTHVTLGENVVLNVHSSVGHDAIIGNGCTLSGHADVTGQAVLEEGVFMGSHACVLPGIKVGSYAKIGAGSVVTRNVAPNTTVFGVPAKRLVVPGKG